LASAASRSDDERHSCRAGPDAERATRAPHVRVHRVKADALVPGDLFRCKPARDEEKDLGLTLGYPGEG
jgi:hypothetical protein